MGSSFPDASFGKEATCNVGDPGSIPGLGRSAGEVTGYPFPCGSAGKESTCNEGDLGLNPGLGGSPGEGKGYAHQYFGLENSGRVRNMGNQKAKNTRLTRKES